MADVERYRVAAGAQIDLAEWDPDDRVAFDGDKKCALGSAVGRNKNMLLESEIPDSNVGS